jgi:hypothetical protein
MLHLSYLINVNTANELSACLFPCWPIPFKNQVRFAVVVGDKRKVHSCGSGAVEFDNTRRFHIGSI